MAECHNTNRPSLFWKWWLWESLFVGLAIIVLPAFWPNVAKLLQSGSGGLGGHGAAIVFVGSGIFAILNLIQNRSSNFTLYTANVSAALFLPLGGLYILTKDNATVAGIMLGLAAITWLIALIVAAIWPTIQRKTSDSITWIMNRSKRSGTSSGPSITQECKEAGNLKTEAAQYYCVQLASQCGDPTVPIIRVLADGSEGKSPGRAGVMKLTLGGKTVAEFASSRVLGWWITDEQYTFGGD